MMLMPGNDGSGFTQYAAGKYEGRIGWLQGPRNWKAPRRYFPLPYALDNDCFTQRKNWSEKAWIKMLENAKKAFSQPIWVLVPDVVADRTGTLERWFKYAPIARRYGWPLAFAVQDGMTPADVPAEAKVVFVGGTTDWKWQSLSIWCGAHPRVHVGRVNTIERLWECQDAGVESVDGTGWIRNPKRQDQIPALMAWLDGERRAYQARIPMFA
jgi:hypothetical protein